MNELAALTFSLTLEPRCAFGLAPSGDLTGTNRKLVALRFPKFLLRENFS